MSLMKNSFSTRQNEVDLKGLGLNPYLLFTAQEIKQFTQPFFSSEDFHLPQNLIVDDSCS